MSSKLTLDEAIKRFEKLANINEVMGRFRPLTDYPDELESKEDSLKRASEERQLVEWLRELKEAKRLLKLAVEDMGEENFCAKVCKRDKFACQVSDTCDFKWRYADEALKLIEEDSDTE